MKKIIISTLVVLLVGIALVSQLLLMKELRSLSDAVDNQLAKSGAETELEDLTSFSGLSWKLQGVVCPYSTVKFNMSPDFGIRGDQERTVSETKNALLYKSNNGDTTYVSIDGNMLDFCG
jgi:hypothetical protein